MCSIETATKLERSAVSMSRVLRAIGAERITKCEIGWFLSYQRLLLEHNGILNLSHDGLAQLRSYCG